MGQNGEVKKEKTTVVLILDNIRSAHNVGSMFRTADAVGVQKIYVTGVTPTPVDRFGRKRTDIGKVALGAEESVLWQYKKDTRKLVKQLKKDGFTITALEQDVRSEDYRKVKYSELVALIVGNEVSGISKEVLKQADRIIEIPMRGEKESLNAAVALGIVLFTIVQD